MSEERLSAETIGGKYKLLRRIGAGGMAEVFLAQQTGLDGFEKLVVLKRIHPHMADERRFVRMFLDEARTAADLRHPNIVQIFDIGESGGTYFLAMEFLNGQNLRTVQKRVRKRGEVRVPLALSLQIVRDIAEGLHYAHVKKDLQGRELGIVHRDVSPQNIILTFEGAIKIVDFGIAKASSKTSRTAPGTVMGKVAYMSPEQAEGRELDARSDQFALGILLYELTTGEPCFNKPSDTAILHAIVSGDVTAPSEVMADYPEALEAIVLRALQAKVDDRYPSCASMAAEIEAYMGSHGIVPSRSALGHYLQTMFPDTPDTPMEAPGRKTAAMENAATQPGGSATEQESSPSLIATPAPATTLSQAHPTRANTGLITVILVAAVLITGGIITRNYWFPQAQTSPTIVPTTAVAAASPSPPAQASPSPATPTPSPQRSPKIVVQRYGTLTVTARGGWVQVFIDGTLVDKETPMRNKRLRAGSHTLRVYNPHSKLNKTQRIRVPPNGHVRVIVDVRAQTIELK